MKIAVLCPHKGWILDTIANRMAVEMPEAFTACSVEPLKEPINGFPFRLQVPANVDGIYYVDMQSVFRQEWVDVFPGRLHVGMMTHMDRNSPEAFKDYWKLLDGVVHMAQRYAIMFHEHRWFRDDQMTVLRPGEVADQYPLRRVRVGICQRGEYVGKGKDFLPEVCKALPQELRPGLAFLFLGKGWLEPGQTDYHGVACSYLDEDNPASYPFFYNAIQYLLVPSLWEGGPMAVLEALAAGTPIIGADVGWVSELADEVALRGGYADGTVPTEGGAWENRAPNFYLYEPGNVAHLRSILARLAWERLSRRLVVQGLSYRAYAEEVLAFFQLLRVRREATRIMEGNGHSENTAGHTVP